MVKFPPLAKTPPPCAPPEFPLIVQPIMITWLLPAHTPPPSSPLAAEVPALFWEMLQLFRATVPWLMYSPPPFLVRLPAELPWMVH